MTIDDAPNVVSEEGLRMYVRQGFRLEVVCRAVPERRYNAWYGKWIIRAVSPDGLGEKLLVTSRSILKVREFKTLTGLVSFLQEFGFHGRRRAGATHASRTPPGKSTRLTGPS